MWDMVRPATSYTVYARGSLGYNDQCDSIDTNCDFRNLACGQDYTITVLARQNNCVSLMSESINATTGREKGEGSLVGVYFTNSGVLICFNEETVHTKTGGMLESLMDRKLKTESRYLYILVPFPNYG